MGKLKACPFERYTKLYCDGQPYLPMYKVSLMRNELVGAPIERLALYESIGLEPAEIMLKLSRTQPENKPLTLEQLYSLVGKEPIYAVSKNNACWCVLDTTLQFGGGTALIAIYGRNMTLSGGDYGKTWLAYKTKPEQEENL